MTPDNLARPFARLEATVPGCIHLGGGQAPYAYLRHLVAPGTYWILMLNPAKDEHLRVLLSLPPSDYVFLQPITLCCPTTHNPTEGRLLAVALLPKAKVSHEHLNRPPPACCGKSTAPRYRREGPPMSPDALACLMRELETTVPKCTHLGGCSSKPPAS
jgi:hypothetical protein